VDGAGGPRTKTLNLALGSQHCVGHNRVSGGAGRCRRTPLIHDVASLCHTVYLPCSVTAAGQQSFLLSKDRVLHLEVLELRPHDVACLVDAFEHPPRTLFLTDALKGVRLALTSFDITFSAGNMIRQQVIDVLPSYRYYFVFLRKVVKTPDRDDHNSFSLLFLWPLLTFIMLFPFHLSRRCYILWNLNYW
jgi:hypothetical protein